MVIYETKLIVYVVVVVIHISKLYINIGLEVLMAVFYGNNNNNTKTVLNCHENKSVKYCGKYLYGSNVFQ